MKPNLFDFATSELSQDAFICWLLAWAGPNCEIYDRPLHQLGLAFLRALLESSSVEVPAAVTSVVVKRQHQDIDILTIVNDDIAILIEDKTDTRNHSGQLGRYRQIIEKDFSAHKIATVYFKTGDQCSYDEIRSAGYSCFLRSDFLKILAHGQEIGIQNPIFSDFHEYLSRIEQRVRDYQRLSFHQWNGDCWKGFFMELRERLGEGKWDYIANPQGGFMGFWWHRQGNVYLQLENGKLCFKIEVKEKTQQKEAWKKWNRLLQSESSKAGFSFVRPKRRSNGTWMTVGYFDGDYRQAGENGILDMERTVEVLRAAEALLNHAVSVKADQGGYA